MVIKDMDKIMLISVVAGAITAGAGYWASSL